jgi:glycosyltransferase involved in cell wall biosynthesis
VDKINLLIVTDEMEVGGTQRQITYMLKKIDKQLFSITLVYFCNRSFLVDELINAGVEVVEIKKTKSLDVIFFYNFYQFLKARNFDIVHCFSFTGELWGTLVSLLTKQKNIISSVRNVYDWYSPLQWKIKKWVSNRSRYVIANSKAGALYTFNKTNISDDILKVVYNGIPEIEFDTKHNACETLSIPLDKKIGLFVGRLVIQKNVPSLIKALNKIVAKGRDFRFYIVGDGPEQIELKKMVSKEAQSSVKFLGEMSNVNSILPASDFVVLPSLREGLSNTILEAMLAGKPVIASAVGGSPELIEDTKTGYLYPSGDENKLVELIELMLDSEDSVLEGLGKKGQTKISAEFSINAMVKKMELLYQTCIDENVVTEKS